MASPEQPASWTGRFVRVYERPRSGFQFSPIISPLPSPTAGCPGRTSRDITLSIISPLFLSLSHRFFALQTAGAVSKLPDVGGLIKRADFPGITDYVLQVLPERKRCPGRKRSSCGRRHGATGGDSISGIYGPVAPRAHACDFCADLGFAVISSYFTFASPCLSFSLSFVRDARQ